MRILMVHDFFAPGNSRFGHEINKGLLKLGHEVHTIAGVGENGPQKGQFLDGILFHTFPYGFNKRSVNYLWYTFKNFLSLFSSVAREYKFDAIIFNQPLSFYIITRDRRARRATKGYIFLSPWAEEWIIENESKKGVYSFLNFQLRQQIEAYALRRSDYIFVLSEFMRRKLIEHHKDISGRKICMIAGGVDTEFFCPQSTIYENREKLSLPQDRFIVFTLRRIVPRMGLDSLIYAIKKIVPKIPEILLIVGGEGPQRDYLIDLARRLDIQDHVIFPGLIPDNKILDYYRSANLFVLPTRALEGFGLVLLEAMSCGVPAMGTPVGAIVEILGNFDRRLIFKSAEPDDISDGIYYFYSCIRHDTVLARRCREFVIQNYQWQKTIDKINYYLTASTK